jgi:hypothetical protein
MTDMRARTRIPSAAAAALVLAGCGGPAVVNTDDAAPTAKTQAPPPPPPLNNANLANAFNYGAPVDGFTHYFFTTPSGRWQCGIVPRVSAGCEATGSTRISIDGAPDEVPDADGNPATPTAIVVDRDGDPHFAALDTPQFEPPEGKANTLPFNAILAVAGFRCNVQEATGVSCVSELTRNGFTFSADGYNWQYTDVPR